MSRLKQILLDELSWNDLDSITFDNILDVMEKIAKDAFDSSREEVVRVTCRGLGPKYNSFQDYLNEIKKD